MPTFPSTTELLKMTPAELTREIRERELETAKLKLQVSLGSHKDTAGYRAGRRHVARLKTVLAKLGAVATKTPKKPLKKKTSDSTLSAPASA